MTLHLWNRVALFTAYLYSIIHTHHGGEANPITTAKLSHLLAPSCISSSKLQATRPISVLHKTTLCVCMCVCFVYALVFPPSRYVKSIFQIFYKMYARGEKSCKVHSINCTERDSMGLRVVKYYFTLSIFHTTYGKFREVSWHDLYIFAVWEETHTGTVQTPHRMALIDQRFHVTIWILDNGRKSEN